MNDSKIVDRQLMIKGLNIYYRTAGDPSDPPVILLNGWGARVKGIFGSERVIKEIARRGFFVYSPEHPGLMRSETPKNLWGQNEYREYIEEFIEKLEIKKPIIIGQSFGGAIATAYAAEHSGSVRILFLIDSGLASNRPREHRFKLRFYGAKLAWYLLSNSIPYFIKKILVNMTLGVPWNYIKKESFTTRSIWGKFFLTGRLMMSIQKLQPRS